MAKFLQVLMVKGNKMEKEELNFEEYNFKLSEIIKKLEKNEVSVEEGTKLYEEGVKIAKKCFEILNTCKGKVVFLKKELENFEPSDISDDK